MHVLFAYDRGHGTDHFRGLVADDITHHEDDIERVLDSLAVPIPDGATAFYREHLWDRAAILAASRPYEGVFGVIRWFQLQPLTQVALNTGRAHHLREDTLESLNTSVRRIGFGSSPSSCSRRTRATTFHLQSRGDR